MSQESVVTSYDHSWVLSIFVEEIDSSYNIRVKDSTVVSMIVVDLINRINLKFDWMDFALWFETKKIWLLPKSSNLSSFGLQANAKVHFVRRYRMVSIQLPDLQIRDILLDFSKTVFQTNHIVCRKMGIRHHEELSFQYRSIDKPKDRSSSPMNIKQKTTFSSQQDILRSNWSLRRNSNHYTPLTKKRDITSFFRSFSNPQGDTTPKLRRKTNEILQPSVSVISSNDNSILRSLNESIYFESFETSKLTNSPEMTFEEARKNGYFFTFKTYRERSKLRFPWMISELSLMEQGIEDFDNVFLLLRYKYHNYAYLDERYDGIRINQIFQQAYWSVMSDETECSEDEALILGGILCQINRSVESEKFVDENHFGNEKEVNLDNEISVLLDKLHLELLGRCDDEVVDTEVEVSGVINILKYPKHFYNCFEKHFGVIKSDGIHLFLNRKSQIQARPTEIIPVIGNEVELRLKLSSKELYILEIYNLQKEHDTFDIESKSIEKYKLKFFDKNEFIRWTTACRLLSKSIDFKNIENFQYENNIVTNILDMKRPLQASEISTLEKDSGKINLENLLNPRINRPFKKKALVDRIIKIQRSCRHYNSTQAKLAYIKCWLTLRHAGLCYFPVTINKGLEKELIGIGYNKLIFGNFDNGKLRKIWELSKLVTWDTNWELEHVLLEFTGEKIQLKFANISECQMFHEYLGGYLFIMMRNSGKYSDLSEKTFNKLTARNLPKT